MFVMMCAFFWVVVEAQEAGYGFGQSSPLNKNILCDPRYQKMADGVVLVNQSVTGFFIKTTKGVDAPRILMLRQHYIDPPMELNKIYKIALTFRYQSATCENPITEPVRITGNVLGRIVFTGFSDWTVVEILYCWSDAGNFSIPVIDCGWNKRPMKNREKVFYIGHPRADIKKGGDGIAYAYSSASPDVIPVFIYPEMGIVEDRSSGSPLFDQNFYVRGALRGTDCFSDHQEALFTRITAAWEKGLGAILDNGNTGVDSVESTNSNMFFKQSQWPVAYLYPLAAVISGGQAHISWTVGWSAISNYRFEIWRSLSGGVFAKVADLSGSATEHVDTLPVGYRGGAVYRVVSVNSIDSRFSFTQEVEAKVGTATLVDNLTAQPTGYALAQNYPNPFNLTTIISYQLPAMEVVELAVYNMLGQKIRSLINGQTQSAGKHEAIWDGRDDYGNVVAGGMYFYKFQAGSFMATRKMLLQK